MATRSRKFRPVSTILFVIMFLAGVTTLAWFCLDLLETRTTPADCPAACNEQLRRIGAGKDYRPTDATALITADRFHGDGEEWYRFKLPPDQIERLRGFLAEHGTLRAPGTVHEFGNIEPPRWWDAKAVPDLQTYRIGEYFLWVSVSPALSKVYIVRVRT